MVYLSDCLLPREDYRMVCVVLTEISGLKKKKKMLLFCLTFCMFGSCPTTLAINFVSDFFWGVGGGGGGGGGEIGRLKKKKKKLT